MANKDYQILVKAQIERGEIDKQLKAIEANLKSKPIKLSTQLDGATSVANDLKNVANESKKAQESMDETALSVDAANKIFQMAKDTISSFVEQVYELDSALTEFKKVSDLSGSSLDKYVSKLSQMGKAVARTGKPNRSEPGRWDGKPASRTAPKPLKALRALSLQHKDEIYLSVNVRNH